MEWSSKFTRFVCMHFNRGASGWIGMAAAVWRSLEALDFSWTNDPIHYCKYHCSLIIHCN